MTTLQQPTGTQRRASAAKLRALAMAGRHFADSIEDTIRYRQDLADVQGADVLGAGADDAASFDKSLLDLASQVRVLVQGADGYAQFLTSGGR